MRALMLAQPLRERREVEKLSQMDAELEQAVLVQRHVRAFVVGGHGS